MREAGEGGGAREGPLVDDDTAARDRGRPAHARRRHHGGRQRADALADQLRRSPATSNWCRSRPRSRCSAFLPLCQSHRGNIIVDTFTTRLPRAVRNALDALVGSRLRRHGGDHRVAAWRRRLGPLRSNTVSMMLGLPIGWAIARLRRDGGAAGCWSRSRRRCALLRGRPMSGARDRGVSALRRCCVLIALAHAGRARDAGRSAASATSISPASTRSSTT